MKTPEDLNDDRRLIHSSSRYNAYTHADGSVSVTTPNGSGVRMRYSTPKQAAQGETAIEEWITLIVTASTAGDITLADGLCEALIALSTHQI